MSWNLRSTCGRNPRLREPSATEQAVTFCYYAKQPGIERCCAHHTCLAASVRIVSCKCAAPRLLASVNPRRDPNRWDRGLPGGTPATTTIIICTKLCAHRYISRVRSSQVLIFYVPGSGYYHGRSCPICTRCFHRCSARIPTIPSIVDTGD